MQTPGPDTDESSSHQPLHLSPRTIAAQLRDGVELPDAVFDFHLPAELRSLSGRHWTPLHVVRRAVRWLEELGVRSVVDVGSGAGKFCIAAALCGDLTCAGLERRSKLVTAARDLARLYGVEDRVRFEHRVFGVAGVPAADAYYFFNPFGENVFGADEWIDQDVELGRDRFAGELRIAREFFASRPVGTLVLTYHGYGGTMPRTYDEVEASQRVPGLLRLFRRAR